MKFTQKGPQLWYLTTAAPLGVLLFSIKAPLLPRGLVSSTSTYIFHVSRHSVSFVILALKAMGSPLTHFGS